MHTYEYILGLELREQIFMETQHGQEMVGNLPPPPPQKKKHPMNGSQTEIAFDLVGWRFVCHTPPPPPPQKKNPPALFFYISVLSAQPALICKPDSPDLVFCSLCFLSLCFFMVPGSCFLFPCLHALFPNVSVAFS